MCRKYIRYLFESSLSPHLHKDYIANMLSIMYEKLMSLALILISAVTLHI